MTFDDKPAQAQGPRFTVTGLAPGKEVQSKVYVPENGQSTLKYTVKVEAEEVSTDASFKEVSKLETE